MAIKRTIRAQVVDLRIDQPQNSDKFLVDTNVWRFLFYTRVPQSNNSFNLNSYQTREYPRYIKKIPQTHQQLFYCGLSLSELGHLIESIERDLYNKQNGTSIGTKTFRNNYPNERQRIAQVIENTWKSVESSSQNLSVNIDVSTTKNALKYTKQYALDGYDLFLLEAMKHNNIDKIITEDADFATVDDIIVFTANDSAIRSAKKQGKYLVR